MLHVVARDFESVINSGSARAALSAALSAPVSYSYDSYRLLEMPIVCYAFH